MYVCMTQLSLPSSDSVGQPLTAHKQLPRDRSTGQSIEVLSTDTEGPQQASRERFFSSDVSAGYIFLVVLSISYTRAQSVTVV